MHDELDPATYGLTIWDLDREFLTGGVAGNETHDARRPARRAARRVLPHDRHRVHAHPGHRRAALDPVARSRASAVQLAKDELRHLLERLNAAEAFEKFLATKYVGTKRFGLEGAESAIPILDTILSAAADDGLDGVVLGMAHRGRLNVLANIVGKSYDQIFREFEGYVDPTSVQGSGDVKYHLGAIGQVREPERAPTSRSSWPPTRATSRPSTRSCSAWCGPARTRSSRRARIPVLPILIHGDAAFAGQGVVAECLAMSDISGLPRRRHDPPRSSTTRSASPPSPEFARSSLYCTDVAKMVQAPIFHVNGDDPEACVRVAAAGLRVPPDVPQGRRHRHGLLPAPRPQRGRRPELHAAADVQGHRRAAQRAQALRRGARASAATSPLDEAEAALADFQHRLQVALDETRAAARRRRSRRPGRRSRSGVLPHVDDRRRPRHARRDLRPPHRLPGRLHAPPQAGPPVRDPGQAVPRGRRGRVGHGRGAGLRLAGARGHRRAPGRRGQPAGHVQPAPRRA